MKKKWLLVIPVLVCLAGICWFCLTHVVLNGMVIHRNTNMVALEGERLPDLRQLEKLKDLESLDVRQITVSAAEYEALAAALPNCRIRWQVPVFGGLWDNEATEVSATVITEEDITAVKYLKNLQTVDAADCADLEKVTALREAWPKLQVRYRAVLGNTELREDATELTLGAGDAAALLAAVGYFPKLEKIDATGCEDYDTLHQLRLAYPDLQILYELPLGDETYAYDCRELALHNADGAQLQQMLPYFTALETVTLTGTAPDQESMYRLMCEYPSITFRWEFMVCGVATSSTATELILSDIPMETVEEVEDSLKYFYDLQRVEMCQCGISNEDMDALWKRHPETRFIWSMPFGTGYLRTDATAFIGRTYGFVFDHPCDDTQTEQLKYCVDMVCLDLGHMRMKDLSFLRYMPNLKYLILADTQAEDYSPVGELTELIFLELFNSDFTDTQLLLNLKNLEDLNISWVKLKQPQLLGQMTWLKRLWATRVGLTDGENKALAEALVNTQVYVHGLHPTEGGWRQAKNYYDMRDLLGMHYME